MLFKYALTLFVILVIVYVDKFHPNRTVACQVKNTTCDPNVSESEKRLLDAIESGNTSEVEALLAAGANPDGRAKINADPFYVIKICHSPLIHALRLNKIDILKLLLKTSYARDNPENYSAGVSYDRSIIETLIAAGGNVNARAEINDTPLIIAARGGRVELLRFLLERGADVNFRNKPGQTALLAATDRLGDSSGSPPVVEMLGADKDKATEILVAAGGDVDASDNDGNTPLILAAQYGRVDLSRFLLAHGANVDFQNKSGESALMAAAGIRGTYSSTSADRDKVIEILVAGGGDINTSDINGNTPLIMAAEYGRVDLARLLLEHGANLALRNKSGQTALMMAAFPSSQPHINENKAKIINLLAINKSDTNVKDGEGNTLLISAARYGWYINTADTIVKALLSAGAEVNARNNNGDTALIEVLKIRDGAFIYSDEGRGNVYLLNTVNILVTAGADVNAENNIGDTPLKIAAVSLRSDRGRMSVLNLLIKYKADVNLTGSVREPVLLLAIRRAAGRSNSEVVQALIKAGADVNVSDDEGAPALILAVRESGNAEVVRLLLEAGARVNDRDKSGDTALIAAVRQYLPSDNEAVKNTLYRNTLVVRALLAAGADITIKGRDGETVIDLAKKIDNKNIIQLLREAETKRK